MGAGAVAERHRSPVEEGTVAFEFHHARRRVVADEVGHVSFVDVRVEAARLVLGCCGAVAAIAQHYAAGGAVSRGEGTKGVEGGVKTGIVAWVLLATLM